MNQHLVELTKLAGIDKAIDDFVPRIEKANAKINAIAEEEQEVEETINQLKEEIKECELKRAKNDLHLQELHQKLEANAKKSADVKTDKEIKALQLEEEIAKEQIDFANEEIDRLENLVAGRHEEIETKEADLQTIRTNGEQVRGEVESELAEIESERQALFEQKQAFVGKMSQKILAFYNKVRRWAKNSAVVPVRKQACMGCFMRINDKTYAEVIKGEEIVTCPHCGRILYLEEQSEPADA